MGSLENGSMNELEDESLTPESVAQKTHSTRAAEQGMHPGWSQAHVEKMFGNIVYRSIKIVIFSNKLNLLMLFGPLAILVTKYTDHRVSLSSPNLALFQIAALCI